MEIEVEFTEKELKEIEEMQKETGCTFNEAVNEMIRELPAYERINKALKKELEALKEEKEQLMKKIRKLKEERKANGKQWEEKMKSWEEFHKKKRERCYK